MIIVNENKLRKCDIELIGNAYGMRYDWNNWSEETYDEFIDSIVDRFRIDIDGFSERLVVSILNNIHNAFNDLE